jgi:hypothetical protein
VALGLGAPNGGKVKAGHDWAPKWAGPAGLGQPGPTSAHPAASFGGVASRAL